MKVAIFSGDYAFNVQEMVNDFIKDKQVVDIKYQSVVHHSYRGDHIDGIHINDRAMVIYEDRYDAMNVKPYKDYKTIKQCPACDHELIYGSKYCDQCGQKLNWEESDDN